MIRWIALLLTALALTVGCDDAAIPAGPGAVTDALPPLDAAPDAAPDAAVDASPPDAGPEPQAIAVRESAVRDPARDREIGALVYAPVGLDADAPVVLVSHGGEGAEHGERTLSHLGTAYAQRGWVAVHVGHRPSADAATHRLDRPADVSHMLDRLEAGQIPLPPGFIGRLDLARVGHVGHSWGAYTSHAVGGAVFDQGQFRDPRVRAIVPISPQGSGGFGAFDRGPADNSWGGVTVPVFTLIGEAELDTRLGVFMADGWRLEPFERYPAEGDKLAAVLPGQTHAQMGSGGSAAVQGYIAESTALFLDLYVADRPGDPCAIGATGLEGVALHRRGDAGGRLAGCPAP